MSELTRSFVVSDLSLGSNAHYTMGARGCAALGPYAVAVWLYLKAKYNLSQLLPVDFDSACEQVGCRMAILLTAITDLEGAGVLTHDEPSRVVTYTLQPPERWKF